MQCVELKVLFSNDIYTISAISEVTKSFDTEFIHTSKAIDLFVISSETFIMKFVFVNKRKGKY